MYWSWQVLHADCIVYDSIITPHAFPTGWLINAIDYLQHWWQGEIIALLYSKLFIFQCVCVCSHARTQALMKIHLCVGRKGQINQKDRKRKLGTQWKSMPFNHCFQYTKNTHFLMLPNRCLALQLNYSFTFLFTNTYWAPTLARQIFPPHLYKKTNLKKNESLSMF